MKDLNELKGQYKKLGDEIKRLEKEDKTEWVICWKTGRVGYFLFPKDRSFEGFSYLYDTVEPVTVENMARFLPKKTTRYDWAKIVKEYPRVQWAATDYDGRIDLFIDKPIIKEQYKQWYTGKNVSPLVCCYGDAGFTNDWSDSLERRPDYT